MFGIQSNVEVHSLIIGHVTSVLISNYWFTAFYISISSRIFYIYVLQNYKKCRLKYDSFTTNLSYKRNLNISYGLSKYLWVYTFGLRTFILIGINAPVASCNGVSRILIMWSVNHAGLTPWGQFALDVPENVYFVSITNGVSDMTQILECSLGNNSC